MKVKIAAITQSLVEGVILTAEELLVYIARVSNPSNQLNTETSDKLIAYMIKNKHWSPFDMVDMTVEVTTSRAVAHQILRHWSIKPQEFSQRYAEAVSFETIEFRKAASSNRQSSEDVISEISFIDDNPPINGKVVFSEESSEELRRYTLDVAEAMDTIKGLYKRGIELGIAKESARMILPLTTSTTMYLKGSVRSWIHYMEQRCDAHAQKEHRIVANEVRKLFIENFPMTTKALDLI